MKKKEGTRCHDTSTGDGEPKCDAAQFICVIYNVMG